jgi:hypothetical protein
MQSSTILCKDDRPSQTLPSDEFLDKANLSEENELPKYTVSEQIALEYGHDVRYRTCSWQKVCSSAFKVLPKLICTDRCVVILRVHLLGHSIVSVVSREMTLSVYGSSQLDRSYSVLGLVPGVMLTVAVAATVQYTSLIIWRFCLKHPELRDVCDIGRVLFGGSKVAYRLTMLMFILNNTFIQGKKLLPSSYPSNFSSQRSIVLWAPSF